jgi:hypothetical protein
MCYVFAIFAELARYVRQTTLTRPQKLLMPTQNVLFALVSFLLPPATLLGSNIPLSTLAVAPLSQGRARVERHGPSSPELRRTLAPMAASLFPCPPGAIFSSSSELTHRHLLQTLASLPRPDLIRLPLQLPAIGGATYMARLGGHPTSPPASTTARDPISGSSAGPWLRLRAKKRATTRSRENQRSRGRPCCWAILPTKPNGRRPTHRAAQRR